MAGTVVLVGGLGTAAGWVDWPALGRWLAPHAALLVLFGVAAGLLTTALARALHRAQGRPAALVLSWWMVAAAGAVVVGVAWGATAWLLSEASQAKDPAAARVEAIKAGLTIGAGTGGVFALLLAVRRQWHQERSTVAIELDAAEKRVTELYTKAVDQLGSDKAPIRMAGLYALERVAQDNPAHRQTVVNVLCAYLRMPYRLPGDPPGDDAADDAREEYRDRVQEREVRLTTQRLLTEHLWPRRTPTNPAATFWPDMDLDLTGALLMNFNLHDCHVRRVSFRSSEFAGDATFNGAIFLDAAIFTEAQFAGDANFQWARFAFGPTFNKAQFTGDAHFEGARFAFGTGFDRDTPRGDINISWARFYRDTRFRSIQFRKTRSHDTRFHETQFDGAEFRAAALFCNAQFGSARFNRVRFYDEANFTAAEFAFHAGFKEAKFAGETRCGLARFGGHATFFGSEFTGEAGFDSAEFSNQVEFSNARFASDATFRGTAFARDAKFYSVEFASQVEFSSARFDGDATFDKTDFFGIASFPWARFNGHTRFLESTFVRRPNFDGTRFEREMPAGLTANFPHAESDPAAAAIAAEVKLTDTPKPGIDETSQ